MARHGRSFPMPRRLHGPVLAAPVVVVVYTQNLIQTTTYKRRLPRNYTRIPPVIGAAAVSTRRRWGSVI